MLGLVLEYKVKESAIEYLFEDEEQLEKFVENDKKYNTNKCEYKTYIVQVEE